MEASIRKIMSKFQGLNRAYGVYDIKSSGSEVQGQKIIGRPKTLQAPVTFDLWKGHIEGTQGIGIVPITDNSTCFFGAIDIDIYNEHTPKKVISDIYRFGLPLIPCRSKSGGVHCFLFVREPVPAILMKEKLSVLASMLDQGKSEIFPKQTEILAERGDIGQWINMPYFDYLKTNRYAYKPNMDRMSLDEFLTRIDQMEMSDTDLKRYALTLVSAIEDGPPCLQTLITKGFSAGTRNDSMFNLALYLQKSDTDWENKVDDYNIKYMDPPLSSIEVQTIIKSLRKKPYNYTCDKHPFKDCCNLQLCRSRKFGVGGLTGMPQLTGLTKFDSTPPVWFVDIEDGGRIELTTDEIQSQSKFQKKCMESINQMPPPMKAPVWQAMVQNLLENVVIIEAPTDASPRGLLFEYLERFCTSRAQARVQDEILLGKPWTTGGKHHFRLIDFMAFLERQRFKEFKVHVISSMLKEIGGEHKFLKIKGKGVNIWIINEFSKQDSSFDSPDISDEQVF